MYIIGMEVHFVLVLLSRMVLQLQLWVVFACLCQVCHQIVCSSCCGRWAMGCRSGGANDSLASHVRMILLLYRECNFRIPGVTGRACHGLFQSWQL
jgi:hypothetical protein